MVVPAQDQGKREFCIAVFNHELHKNSICPGNHSIDYDRGWYHLDDRKEQRPEFTRIAERLMKEGRIVYYSPVWNTYVVDCL